MAERTTEAKTFDDLVDVYEALVDWPKRLAHETPFYKELFAEVGVRRVLDVACGTGHHVAMFHAWGLETEGADISPAMIARCRQTHGDGERLRWVVRGFDTPCESPGAFDAAVCVGNSLSLATDRESVRRAVEAMLTALRPGGVCIIGVLNLWRLPEGSTRWQPCKRRDVEGESRIVVKGIHRVGSRGYIDLIDLKLDAAGAMTSHFEQPTFSGLEAEALQTAAANAGAVDATCYGTFQRAPYVRTESPDLICVCRAS